MPPEVLARLAEHRAVVGRMLDTISDDVLAAWVRAWSDIERELLTLADAPTTRARRRRLEDARRQAAAHILRAASDTGTILTTNARVMIERGMWEQPALIAAQLPPAANVTLIRPPGAEVEWVVRRSTQQITALTYALSVEATTVMNRALNLGMAAGINPRQVAARMVQQARDAFDGGIARAQVIARTEMIDAHRNAAQASQAANADVLAGWMWVAQLGPRTCASCVIQHGQIHPLDIDGPLDHHQGRCARVPVTKPWTDLGFTGIKETRPRVETGQEWFDRQPEAVQRSVLGPKRFEAWQAGDYPTEAWSVRRETAGWRDAFHVGPVPG